jgi:hypothetical protein
MATLALYALTAPSGVAQPPDPNDLTKLSLEDLMNMRVTSVSKREQPISKAGAAVYVITLPGQASFKEQFDTVPAPRWILETRGAPFGLLTISGNPAPTAETLKDFEAGYRAQIGARLSLDLAAFTKFYRDLRSTDPQTPFFTTNPGSPH